MECIEVNMKRFSYIKPSVNLKVIFLFSDPEKGFHIGDSCVNSCSKIIENSFCNTTSNTCQCKPTHDIEIQDGISCVNGKY